MCDYFIAFGLYFSAYRDKLLSQTSRRFILLRIPTLVYPLIIYNLIGLFAADALNAEIFRFLLVSGSEFIFTTAHLFLIVGVICLTIEVIKSTRTTVESVLDHSFSVIVFIVYLLEFILVRFAGNAEFLILTLMALADVITGFAVTIFAARRDVSVEGGGSIFR